MDNHNNIVKADNVYRRRLFLSYLSIIFAGIIFCNFFLPQLLKILNNLPNKERVEVTETISHLFLLSFVPFAIYVIVIGRRVCRYNAMPYPGMKVIRDTVIVTGKRAMLRGKSLIVLGTAMITLALVSMISTHYIILRFKHYPLFRSYFYGVQK